MQNFWKSPITSFSLVTNFCYQKLVVIIHKCEKHNTKKAFVVVKLWATAFWTNYANVFSIRWSKAIKKLLSVINLVDYILPFFFCWMTFHVIWSQNAVYCFAYRNYKFVYRSFMYMDLIFHAIFNDSLVARFLKVIANFSSALIGDLMQFFYSVAFLVINSNNS